MAALRDACAPLHAPPASARALSSAAFGLSWRPLPRVSSFPLQPFSSFPKLFLAFLDFLGLFLAFNAMSSLRGGYLRLDGEGSSFGVAFRRPVPEEAAQAFSTAAIDPTTRPPLGADFSPARKHQIPEWRRTPRARVRKGLPLEAPRLHADPCRDAPHRAREEWLPTTSPASPAIRLS